MVPVQTTAQPATLTRPALTKTPAQAAYSGERRSRAAKWGWAMRRWVPNPVPNPETVARDRLAALLLTVDPVAARLYACRIAESVMPHYTERYPGDDGCAAALAAARRFAHRTLREWGRRRDCRMQDGDPYRD